MGFGHIAVGTVQRYTFCPPASGPHNAVTGFAPISPLRQIYGPDDTVAPQQWIHNLEHGALVVLYSCKDGCPDDASKQQLQQFFDDFPASPLCNIATLNIILEGVRCVPYAWHCSSAGASSLAIW